MFTSTDLTQLEQRGITVDEALRQLQLLRHPPSATRLHRPCTIGNGVVRLEDGEHASLLEAAAAAADAGRVTKFVTASGAATRMFKDLIGALAAPDRLSESPAARRFFEQLDQFPFAAELRTRARVQGPVLDERAQRHVLHTLLIDMEYAELPKALIAFHRVGDTVRTALEEQLLEGSRYSRAADGRTKTHFSVAPEHRHRFDALLARTRPRIEQTTHAVLDVSFSEQHPSSDTLASTPDGALFRTEDGGLLFRPAGHGALLGNLQQLGGDLVVVKNIDNVRPYEASEEIVRWKRLLIGYLVRLLEQAPHDRPVRVCGVVKNEGEPGGAPFWVIGTDGALSPQIVEAAQVNLDDPDQRRIFESSTHFNPVDLVCAVRGPDGRPFDLAQFVDPSAVFLSKKSHEGRDLVALERPGLWNGAMARWHTVFIEVPAATFAPVKTVFDLLRPQHQSL
jgi:hypothetical protein